VSSRDSEARRGRGRGVCAQSEDILFELRIEEKKDYDDMHARDVERGRKEYFTL
jgi:hypothetical protein